MSTPVNLAPANAHRLRIIDKVGLLASWLEQHPEVPAGRLLVFIDGDVVWGGCTDVEERFVSLERRVGASVYFSAEFGCGGHANCSAIPPPPPWALRDPEHAALRAWADCGPRSNGGFAPCASPPTLRFLIEASQMHGERTFLVFEDERVTFSAHWRAVCNFAHVLKDEFGVEKGDRVAIIMRNYPQWPVAFYAALSLGAIATPMNSWWTGEELEYGLSFAGVKAGMGRPSASSCEAASTVGACSTSATGAALRRAGVAPRPAASGEATKADAEATRATRRTLRSMG